jgi:tetratricopeptide (TPR) repeat protein
MNPVVETKLKWRKKAVAEPDDTHWAIFAKLISSSWNGTWIFLILFITTLPAACLPHKKLTIGAAASLLEDVAKSSYKQSDLNVIREGMPAYLLLMDGMVEAWPTNERLLIVAAQGYSSYASAFVEDLDKNYARALYGRATDYALRSLEERGFKNPRQRSFEEFSKDLKNLGKKDVPYLFWAAACWGNWIGLNLSSIEAVAELPRVELMMRRALELDEGFYYGGPHLFMGIWYASRPKIAGGNLDLAQDHFQKAIELGQGKFLLANVYYAKYYARRVFDEDLFRSTLQKVLETPPDITPELTLLNTIAHQKAQNMLDHIEEYF